MTNDKIKVKASDYLRARRPERYSDSISIEEPQITENLLDYHLETLTSRSQEKEFEHFARKLSEKELCPNLLPQTGPTGGGDSKVDTETYPVAEDIAFRWYQGSASAKERWAFAISAKKDWRSKIKSDVKKIAETNRDYSLIYFITNQYVADKKRAEVEDTLSKEFKIPVRILDKSWIIDRIINYDAIDIAAQTLSIESLKILPRKKLGPKDAQRQIELETLDADIKNTERYRGTEYQLAEDCLSSAILACNLEKDRQEVDGRFAAALRIAEGVGDKRQILRIVYQQAWQSCFVYDDVKTLSELYGKVEELAFETNYADDVERVQNLFSVLIGCVKFEQINSSTAKIEERSKSLRNKLDLLSKDDSRPNNAHTAKTMLCLHDFSMLQFKENGIEEFDQIFSELEEIFEQSRNFGQYPFDSFKQIIYELGDIFPENAAFEKLYNSVVTLIEERASEGEAGIAIVNRGIQKFKAEKIHDAIKLFGKAQGKLVKDEYKEDLIRCLIACGGTYKAADLFWASRSNLLSAISIILFEFNKSGFMHPLSLLAVKELIWVELRLGRIPHVLFCLMLLNFISSNIKLDEEDKTDFFDFTQHVDAVLSMLLLRLNIGQLKQMTKIPHVLDQMGLVCSEGSLLFSMGNFDKLREDVWFNDDESDDKITEFYQLLYSQPANEELTETPETGLSETVLCKSKVLGCDLVVQADNKPNSILITETFLGALEAFLATSLESGVMPYKKDIKVLVKQDNAISNKFGIEIRDGSNQFVVKILYKEDFNLDSSAKLKNFRDLTYEFIASILPKIAVFDNIETYFQRLAEEENVFDRSLIFSDIVTVSNNVFGSLEWMDLHYWSNSIEAEAYPVNRAEKWQPSKKKPKEELKQPLKRGEGEPPEDVLNQENLKHGDRNILSIIDIPAWNQAKWSGSFFMVYPEGQFPPCLGLLFKDERAARKIFEAWLEDIGQKDMREQIRISLLTGVDSKNPSYYRVHIGSNINAFEPKTENKQVLMVSRINTMTPHDTKNLDMFLEAYKQHGVYCILPAIYEDGKPEPKVLSDLFIFKKELQVRPAWEVGDNDDDFMAIQPDDQPNIPDNVKNAPVLKALERKKNKR